MADVTRLRLSPHFTVEEFDSGDGALVPRARERDLVLLCDYWLEPLRARFGPVNVRSGYRSWRHNDAVGGARGSIHLLSSALPGALGDGRRAAAADVTTSRGRPGEVAAWARWWRERAPGLRTYVRGGIGSYPSFVHLDTWKKRDW
jgi:hypothetical protein